VFLFEKDDGDMIKILIADDHAIVREGLKQILSTSREMGVTGECVDGRDVLEKIRAGEWDVILLDMSMPGLSGIDLIKRIKDEKPGLPVLVLSMHHEDQFALRALKAGASGYLTKESAPALLVSAVRKVAGGGKYISPALAEKLAFEMDPFKEKPLHEMLSDREYQILRMIVSGKSINQIAADLSLSAKTVSTHKTRVMQKLNVDNNARLIQYALTNHLND
jgi:DNA-binding NarL/FixJ family response regulator